MWPYTGKKTYFTNLMSNLDLPGTPPVPNTPGKGSLDKEYYSRFVSPAPGQLNFPANHIADDGRVYRCYGLNNREITDMYSDEKRKRNRVQVNVMKPSKQLHERNVNRLKVVLSMPEKERKISLSHVTGAIMRNEIVPSEARLQNDAFLSDYVRTSTPKLPPLRRKSLQLAKNIEVKIRTGVRRPLRQRPSLVQYQTEDQASDEEGSDMILPAITVDMGRGSDGQHKELTPEDEMKAYRLRGALPTRRKSSFIRLFRAKERTDDASQKQVRYYEQSLAKQLDRKDSVGRTTEAISEQFRAVIQEQLGKASSQTGGQTEPEINLGIAGKSSRDTLTKQLAGDAAKNVTNGYKLRHEYGKNLEKNWFKKYVMKQTKSKTRSQDARPDSCGLRLDIFYSPEPVSDSEIDESYDNGFLEDDTSIQCGGFSTATAAALARRRSEKTRRISNMSTGAIFEVDEPLSNDDSSQSDIEIVLKENQLIQRKTKHKMRKKRQRQLERYKTFMPEETKIVPEVAKVGAEVPLTDQEIRAIRLNLRNKERLKKLKGKRKFLQVANAVYIVAQFKKILKNIRKRKKNIIKRRQQRIAALVAKRMALKEAKENEQDEDEEDREPTPKPTLKDQFMSEIGNRLVFELGQLNIDDGDDADDADEEDSDEESVVETQKNKPSHAHKVEKSSPSKYATELKKVSLKDADNAGRSFFVTNRMFKRRNSIPKGNRPLEFVVEVPYKPKRKANKNNKANSRVPKRPPSPEIKCSCYVHNKRLEASSRASFTSQSRLGKCQHQGETKKQRMKKVRIPTGGLFRTQSLEDLSKMRPIELRELLQDIDIPAKEIKLQILDRKFRRERRRRQRIRLSPCRLPEISREVVREESESGSEEAGSDDSDKSDYDFVYGGPFVGCGVMWHQTGRSSRKQTWTAEDVDREVKKITRVFHELKECRYLRLDSFNAAIMAKLNEKKHLL